MKSGRPAIRIHPSKPRHFDKILPELPDARKGIKYEPLKDGSVYIRFFHFFRFHVSKDGRSIVYQALDPLPKNTSRFRSPLVFLQTNVLSFSLLKLGIEVFHASAVAFREKAVAFLGESGYGKSTTAAAFLKKGYPLLTDDLLAIHKNGQRFEVRPGVPQIKLWPKAARALAPGSRPSDKMSPAADKWILPLSSGKTLGRTCRAGVLYVLWPRFKKGGNEIRIRRLKPQEAAISLIKSSHNLIMQDPARLRAQMAFASELARAVPIRSVSFPRDFRKIPTLREKLLKDIQRQI